MCSLFKWNPGNDEIIGLKYGDTSRFPVHQTFSAETTIWPPQKNQLVIVTGYS